jgi:MFS family permease
VQYKHVSPVAVAAVLAAGEIAITLLEVPTGRFADRFGHRRSLILGSAIQVVAMLLCWLAEGVSGLVVASVCVALGDTFRSGADQALLFESCVADGQPQRFQQIEAKTHSLELIGLVVMMAAGGILVETMGFAAAWIAETVLAASGLAIALAMASPPGPSRNWKKPNHEDREGFEDHEEKPSIGLASFFVSFDNFVPFVVKGRVIVPAALIGGAASATTFMAQTGESATPMQLTVLVSAITLSEAAGAALARYLRADVATQYWLLATSLLLVTVMAAAPGFFLAGAVTLSVLTGAAAPLRATAIQLVIEQRRAEAASWASALDGAIRTLALLVAGHLSGTR